MNNNIIDVIKNAFCGESALFVTGTDTEVGKTYCSALMLKALLQQNVDVNPLKIIAAGVDDNGVNEDAQSLHDACQHRFSIKQISPIVYKQPIAPHIAAQLEGQALTQSQLDAELNKAKTLAGLTIVEGAGGWCLPINNSELLSEWVVKQEMPVVLVVGIRLGCLNHSILTAQSIIASGAKISGWIANFIDEEPNPISEQNVAYLETYLAEKFQAPLLFRVTKNQKCL